MIMAKKETVNICIIKGEEHYEHQTERWQRGGAAGRRRGQRAPQRQQHLCICK